MNCKLNNKRNSLDHTTCSYAGNKLNIYKLAVNDILYMYERFRKNM